MDSDMTPLMNKEDISLKRLKTFKFALTVFGCVGLTVAIALNLIDYFDDHISSTTTFKTEVHESSTSSSSILLSKFLSIYEIDDSILSTSTYTSTSTSSTESPVFGSSFSIFSLNVWGLPKSFGGRDKTIRINALSDWIANDKNHDVYLINDLWMRIDHKKLRSALPPGYFRV